MSRLLIFWLLSSLWLLAGPAAGQAGVGQKSPVLPDSAAEAARADTAIAVQRLFFERRRGGRKQLPFSGLVVGGFGYTLATYRPETTYQRVSTVGLGVVGAYYGGLFVSLLARQRRYRPAREQRVLDALEQGQPLPRRLRKQLKPAYFGVKTDNGAR